MDINIEDVTHLLQFAQKWYREKPGTQIPFDIWGEMVDAVEEQRISWGVYDGDSGVERVNGRLIPALAAISLGVSTEALHDILMHHEAIAEDLCLCTFVKLHDVQKPKKQSPFATWNTTQALMRAFCLKKEHVAQVMAGSEKVYRSPEFNLALLTVPDPDLWPVTSIREHVKIDREGSGHAALQMTSINAFKASDVDFNQFTDAQVLALLDRSGNLCPGALVEHGFERCFFSKFFQGIEHPNLQRILAAINAIEHPALIEKMGKRILDSVSNLPAESGSKGLLVLMGMLRLDSTKYANILNSIILTLNIMPNRLFLDASSLADPTTPALFDGFCRAQDKVLLRLQNELMALSTSDFRLQHFHALGRFSNEFKHAQDLSEVDIQSLMIHCVEALDVYWKTTHLDRQGELNGVTTIAALEDTEAFVTYALKHFEPDPKRFEHLSPLSQRILADNGMDLRKLPGLTRKDRGEVLCDQLGL
jgi:hypothetical protein